MSSIEGITEEPQLTKEQFARALDYQYTVVDLEIRKLHGMVQAQSGTTSALAHWILLTDERYFKDGAYQGGNVDALTKPEQPSYISEGMFKQAASKYGIPYWHEHIREANHAEAMVEEYQDVTEEDDRE